MNVHDDKTVFIIIFLSLLLCLCFCYEENSYIGTWVIKVHGGEKQAKLVAHDLNLIFHGQVGSLQDLYLVQQRDKKRNRREDTNVDILLTSHKSVVYVQQQKLLKKRVKRGYFTDPLFSRQWYLQKGYSGCNLGMNVIDVWRRNITGKGVVVTVVDDGIEYTHPDLKRNYDPKASYDYNNHDSDPIPRYTSNNLNKHGTRCAGEISSEEGNAWCGVGIAYNSNIGGIRMLDGSYYDALEASSLSHNPNHIDIYCNSWGPDDDGKSFDGPGPLTIQALQKGALNGRNGLGSIYVWAAGNGGIKKDYCSCDGYVNMPETIVINAIDYCGKIPYYFERCPGIFAVTYSSGSNTNRRVSTTDLRNKCTTQFTGTSAAAPLAAGILALALEANPNITWRDIQHLIVRSAKVLNPSDPKWTLNGAGHRVSTYYGFGVMDAGAIVTMALDNKWKTSNRQHICTSEEIYVNKDILPNQELTMSHVSVGCNNTNHSCIRKLEHVRIYITLSSKPRGWLKITLTSPAGTVSPILEFRSNDLSYSDIKDWGFLTVFFWDENPFGTWKLNVTQHDTHATIGKMVKWKLQLYGTCDRHEKRPEEEKEEEKDLEKKKTESSYSSQDILFYVVSSTAGLVILAIISMFAYKYYKKYKQNRSTINRKNVVSFSNNAYQ